MGVGGYGGLGRSGGYLAVAKYPKYGTHIYPHFFPLFLFLSNGHPVTCLNL